jgi:hypothetical protein
MLFEDLEVAFGVRAVLPFLVEDAEQALPDRIADRAWPTRLGDRLGVRMCQQLIIEVIN